MSWIGRNGYLNMDEMTTNAQYILDYLSARGWTKNSICGMLGNMQTESTINPGIWESLNYGNTSGGYGLVQWTPATKLINWCVSVGKTYEQMDSQLDRILYEVENNIQWIHSTMTFQEFTQSTDTAYNLAMLFITAYERPYDPNQPIRGEQAEYWYTNLVGGGSNEGSIKVESAVNWAIGIANDNSHGYDQENRWGADYDCSSLLISAYEQAGITVKTNGATYTGNMRSVFTQTGFVEVAWGDDMNNLIRGDVLVNEAHHTAMYIGDGQFVEARINELGTVTGGQTGDQTGEEIWTTNFYNYPTGGWDVVLRFPHSLTGATGFVKLVYPYWFGSHVKISYLLNKFQLLTSHGNVARIQNILSKRKYYVNKSSIRSI